jgi:CheY-like chemotaxis protein
MRILIAEDDFTSRTVLAAVLKKAGHEVTATVNGAEAWQALQQPDAPSLAILDWMMPEIDGLAVADGHVSEPCAGTHVFGVIGIRGGLQADDGASIELQLEGGVGRR